MARPRRQPYPLESYFTKIKDGEIDNSADVQRKFVWKPEQTNGLIRTVLLDDYIPPIILGEEENEQLHIVDGGQRTAALTLFRFGNYKITKNVEDSVIKYKKKTKDENGKVIIEDAEFDIKNKTYEMLPEELKKKFNEYVLETVIHEKCDRKKISKYIKIYNQQITMNVAQKAYTYIYNFAENINYILNDAFFTDYSSFTESEKVKGVTERIVLESVMCMFHLDKWKKQTKEIAQYLNDNSSEEEFNKLDDNLHRLENVITNDIKDIFNSKNSFIWLTLFHRFTSLGLDDDKFADFLRAFKNGLKDTTVNGQTFDDADKARSTKDKAVVLKKINIAESLMMDFLHIDNEASSTNVEVNDKTNTVKIEDTTSKDIVMEFIDNSTDEGDMELYEMIANDISESIDDINTPILSEENRPSFVAIVAYASKKDVDELLKEWLKDNYQDIQFIKDQKQNYLYMKERFEEYCIEHEKSE